MDSFYFTDIFTKLMAVGSKKFNANIDLTDPCYDKDVWCRTSVEVIPGDYICFARKYDNRIIATAIMNINEVELTNKGLKDLFFEKYSKIGVDSGLAGYFNNKPDYEYDQWLEFCEIVFGSEERYFTLNHKSNELIVDGFFSETGWGDGYYPVYVAKNSDNTVVGVAMLFGEFE